MQLKVRLFAAARTAIEDDSVSIEIANGSTIAELRDHLAQQHPELAPILAHSRFAINQDYANDETLIPADAEIALIPPVSGG